MALLLSPAKLVLLAVHFAVNGDINSLTTLAARHGTVLRTELLLRILLTYLPETVPSSHYVDLVQQVESSSFPDAANDDVDCSAVEDLPDDAAAKKVKKLRLLPLNFPEAPAEIEGDALALFLLRRAHRVDEEAGLLSELPDLLLPFLDHTPCIRSLLVTTILPLLRRNCEYYPHDTIPYTIQGFQELPDRVAVNLLLSQTGTQETGLSLIGRDLRGLIGPWLATETRWKDTTHIADSLSPPPPGQSTEEPCPGWDEVMRWLTTQAAKSWRVAVNAVLQWDGPGDADLNGWDSAKLRDDQRQHLEQSYGRAALASAYLIPEASAEALDGAFRIVDRVGKLRSLGPASSFTKPKSDIAVSARNATYMRNEMLSPSNPLTSPTAASVAFLQALIQSAQILTKGGSPCTVRRAGELALLRDEREQKADAAKLIHAIRNNGPKTDDAFWIHARKDILWLKDWGTEDGWFSEGLPCGVFSQVEKEFLEVEILKALLSNTRYTLARNIYEDGPDQPLDRKVLQDTLYAAAMSAYDNASNPNRTRGGLKKCDDIIKAFPKTIQRSDPQAKRIEALLQATHTLSEYRLVLKQGEPFTPVVLRVHKDPVSIIEKILEQNPKSYTHLHDLVTLGTRMVEAGLTSDNSTLLTPKEAAIQRLTAERRITAMCINTALKEDDFETAYSYVVNRISSLSSPAPTTDLTADTPTKIPADDYSWKAALQAGKYRRTPRTLTLPHAHHGIGIGGGGGLASGNPDVRHLEQRIECLATALRVAPPATLQEIVNAFRRAEEELDVLIREEEAREDEWDARGDSLGGMPGAFGGVSSLPSAPATTTRSGRPAAPGIGPAKPTAARRRQSRADEDAAPMSLFDLSRASVLSAQRNLSALSGLQRSAGFGRLASGGLGALGGGGGEDAGGRSSLDMAPLSAAGSTTSAGSGDAEEKRVRKRDQLREAAMGTLVSGVGWLVGAQPPPQARE